MCLWVILMEMKASDFMAFATTLSAGQICKYARKVLTDITNSNASPLCIRTLLARRGRENLRE